jgi:hypothetical protein
VSVRPRSSSANAQALRVCYATLGWSGLQGAAAVAEGLQRRSAGLAGVGATLLLDMGSSAVLVWRFRHPDGGARPERAAAVVASVALAGVAVGLAIGSLVLLVSGVPAHVGTLSVALAGAGLATLPPLARWKYRVAVRVGSVALRTDAHITSVAATMAGVTLVGLAATSLLRWNWADPVAGLVVAALAVGALVWEPRSSSPGEASGGAELSGN